MYRCIKPIIKGPHKEAILEVMNKRFFTMTKMAYRGSTVVLLECKRVLAMEKFAFFNNSKNIRDCFLFVNVGKRARGLDVDYTLNLHDNIRNCFTDFNIHPILTAALDNVKSIHQKFRQ